MKFLGTKKLETERLILRKINQNDYKKAYENWCNNDNVTKYLLWSTHKNVVETKEIYDKAIKEYESDKTFKWIIELKENGEVIGTIDVSKSFLQFGVCEIGYCIGEKFWNKGYMTEAYQEVIRFLFEECEAKLIVGEYMEGNVASGKVMEKCGLKYETRLRKRTQDKDGKENDLIVYSYTIEEYKKDHSNLNEGKK